MKETLEKLEGLTEAKEEELDIEGAISALKTAREDLADVMKFLKKNKKKDAVQYLKYVLQSLHQGVRKSLGWPAYSVRFHLEKADSELGKVKLPKGD